MVHFLLLARIAAGGASVHGVVRSASDDAPLAGVTVDLETGGRAVTDNAGRYRLTGIAGSHQIHFVAMGFAPRAVTVEMRDSTDLDLDVELTPLHVRLPELDVVALTGAAPGAVATRDLPWTYRLGSGWQAELPAGDVDAIRAAATLPGVASRGIGPALSVHGGFGSQNAVLLDGIPLYGAVHFAGAASGVDPDAVRDITVYTGVQPARFGDVIGGTIALNTGDATPDTAAWSGALTAVDARNAVRVPLGRGSALMVGVRSSFRDLLTDAAPFGARNGYQDAVATFDVPLAGGTLRALGYGSGNRIRWAPFATADGSGSDGPGATILDNSAEWSSGAAGLSWRAATHADRSWNAAAWWTGTLAAIGTVSATHADALSSGVSEFGLSLDRRTFGRRSTTVLGAQLTRPRTWYAITSRQAGSADPTPGLALHGEPIYGTAFADWDVNAIDALDIAAGLRATTDFARANYVDPRLTMSVRPDGATRLTLGFGSSHQPLQSMLNEENVMSLVAAPALLVAPQGDAPVARSDEWQADLARRLSRGATLTLGGYARRWSGVLTPAVAAAGYFLTTVPLYGAGGARGAFVALNGVDGPMTFDMTAGIGEATQRAAGTTYQIGTGQPWSLDGNLFYRPRIRTTLLLRLQAGAGQYATPIADGLEWRPYQPATGSGELEGSANNLVGPINADRLPSALRVDLGARQTLPLGTRSSLNVGIQFENLLNRADPVGLATAADGTVHALRGTPRGLVLELGWQF